MTAPDEVARLLTRLADGPDRLGALFSRLEAAGMTHAALPDEWTPAQILAHVRAANDLTAARIFYVLVRDNPRLLGYDDVRWVEVAKLATLPPTEVLETLRRLRRELVHALSSLGAISWQRSGVHEARGPLSVWEIANDLADHEEEHCAQLARMAEAQHV